MSTPAILECLGVTKVFKDFWMRPCVTAVDGLDLFVEPRQVFGLLGPNGAGKSTTIKMILGLLYPTAGRIGVFGKPPTDVAVKARIGYLPEESHLYRFLNARETLDFYGRLFNLERRERNRRMDMLLDMVGLEAVQRRPVGEYSKGMQRRIGLAQALINDPDLLILDEPTTGLDPLGTRQIKDLILQLKARGKTVLLCSHLLADVEDVCDRVTILYGGKVRALGTMDELLRVTESVLIEADRLNPETLEKVRRIIETEGSARVHRMEQPRLKLEAFFLDIVRQAHAEGVQTSGARTGRAVAQFLTTGAEAPKLAGGQEIIRELVQALQPSPTPKPPEKSAPPAEDQAVLKELTRVMPAAVAVPLAAPTPATLEQAQETVDRGVIDGLLGKDQVT